MIVHELKVAAEYETLLHSCTCAPVGLAQTSLNAGISMINPLPAQLLMPVSRDGSLTNLIQAWSSATTPRETF